MNVYHCTYQVSWPHEEAISHLLRKVGCVHILLVADRHALSWQVFQVPTFQLYMQRAGIAAVFGCTAAAVVCEPVQHKFITFFKLHYIYCTEHSYYIYLLIFNNKNYISN